MNCEAKYTITAADLVAGSVTNNRHGPRLLWRHPGELGTRTPRR